MSSVEWEVGIVECEVWSVKCKYSVGCKVWRLEYRVGSGKCGVGSGKCGVFSVECGV